MTKPTLGLVARSWSWRYYIIGLGAWLAIEIILAMTSRDRYEFIIHSRDVGTFGTLFTIVFKLIVSGIMKLTRGKTTLDRRWIWHMDALTLLFIYAYTINTHPEWHGLPRPGIPASRDVPDRTYVSAWIWFQLWGFVMWSSLAVLISTWRERGRYVWDGAFRSLRYR